jgi:RNA polymerase sigma factor (sigma-70 family)
VGSDTCWAGPPPGLAAHLASWPSCATSPCISSGQSLLRVSVVSSVLQLTSAVDTGYTKGKSYNRKSQVMRDDPAVVTLVVRAADGDQAAWDEIVERYAPLVWAICLRHELDRQSIDDIGQSVWLLLVENISRLREPAALPGWLATTTRRECLRAIRARGRHGKESPTPADEQLADESAEVEQEVIEAELHAALRAAFAELPAGCRELLSMLISDPPPGYASISATLGIPMGSIGPTRARCLAKLRRSRFLAAIVAGQEGNMQVSEAGR